MGYLIDTNVLSELRKGPRCNEGVAAWQSATRSQESFISVISVGEIRRGIENIRPRDPVTAGIIEKWVDQIIDHFGNRILPVTVAIADRWGQLSPSQPIDAADGLIAATGIEHKLTIVTRNTSDFARSGANTLNPFR